MAYAAKGQGNALGLSDDESKALEQTRQRLYQLSNSISSLRQSIVNSNPLPPSSSLLAQYQILLRNLQSTLDVLTENSVPFAHMSVHPAVNYPGRTQENVLLTLLRKKREPSVEERIEQGLETTAGLRAAVEGEGDDMKNGIQRLEEVWESLREWTTERVTSYVRDGEAVDVYTKKERAAGIENVRSGLRRALEEPDEDEDEDESDEGDDDEDVDLDVIMGETTAPTGQTTAPPPEPELLFWFAARGDYDIPPNVELEKDAAKRARLSGVPRM
ncbi:mediator of RNA polymerase II transcription complex subunit 8-domain-containing protein [Plectosphaerella plurivora]|uniref:Mediator of RNA polymerase II transcription subunit 8 n=1 Tax=Plectosphaerella plurivora TaxID=936078 RepID=A0A9P9ADA1_9PEZI|nr:mediator of RNA polymerase II transcription complex subunit 8-domain-containing protein [Plectosphaerella plurivora]